MSDKQDTREMLVSGNVFKTMLTLSVPAVLGMVVIGLYNFMDAVFVGQMVGPVAMTAVKVSYPFTLINSGIATLIGQGSASVLSRAIGERDKDTVDRIMGNLISFVTVLSLLVIVQETESYRHRIHQLWEQIFSYIHIPELLNSTNREQNSKHRLHHYSI